MIKSYLQLTHALLTLRKFWYLVGFSLILDDYWGNRECHTSKITKKFSNLMKTVKFSIKTEVVNHHLLSKSVLRVQIQSLWNLQAENYKRLWKESWKNWCFSKKGRSFSVMQSPRFKVLRSEVWQNKTVTHYQHSLKI